MKTLRQKLLTTAAIVSLGLSTVAVASPWGARGPMMGDGPEDCPMMGRGAMGGGPGHRMERMQQHHAEQMELLEARLKLKPEQQAVWKDFIAAQNAHHLTRVKMREERRDREPTAVAHFEEQMKAMEQNLASMKTLAKTAGDLYTALDPVQKKVMDDFFATRSTRRMMRGPGPAPAPAPEQPAQPAQ